LRPAELDIAVVASPDGSAEARVFVPSDFAGFAGHFPAEPVLPAMCHVDLALRAASRAFGALDLVAVERARFPRKTLPDETLTIRIRRDAAGRLHCEHRVGDAICAQFVLEVSSRPAVG
jgi:3-hydroxymyristoyl/3-hydroxydecanoyl-(acyl carrier protein) dehydratase